MNVLKKSFILAFFCYGSSFLFGMNGPLVWDFEKIEKEKSSIFEKVTEVSKSAAAYIVKEFKNGARQKNITFLQLFTASELHVLFCSIRAYAQDVEEEIKTTKSVLRKTYQKACGFTGPVAEKFIDEIMLGLGLNADKFLSELKLIRELKIKGTEEIDREIDKLKIAENLIATFDNITSESKIVAAYIIKWFNDPTTKQKTVAWLNNFTTPQLQNMLLSLKKIELIIGENSVADKKIKVCAKRYVPNKDLFQLYATIYLNNLLKTAAQDSKSSIELAVLISSYENIKRVEQLENKLGKDALLELFKKALPGFMGVVSRATFFDSDPTVLISALLGEEKVTEKAKSLLNPDQFIYSLPKDYLEKVLIDIDRDTALIIARKLTALCKPIFFNALNQKLRQDDDIIFICAQAIITAAKEPAIADLQLVGGTIVKMLTSTKSTDNKKKISAQEMLNRLDAAQIKILLKSVSSDLKAVAIVFTNLTKKNQDLLGGVKYLLDELKLDAEILYENLPEDLTKKNFPILFSHCKNKQQNNFRQDTDLGGIFAALVPGVLSAYSFFNWKNWGDIKNKNVSIPLAGAFLFSGFLSYGATKARADYFSKSLYYGPLMGTVARLFLQKNDHYSVRSISTKPNILISTAGAVSGFLAGLFDLNFMKNILQPLSTFLGKKNSKTDSDKKIALTYISSAVCYVTKTGISMLSPLYTKLVETTESAGRTVRPMAQQIGLLNSQT